MATEYLNCVLYCESILPNFQYHIISQNIYIKILEDKTTIYVLTELYYHILNSMGIY